MTRMVARYTAMIVGFLGIAAGIVLCVRAGLGPGPWDVFHVGLAGATGAPLGRTITLVGLALIVVDLLIGVKPTVCTVLNMVLVGWFVDAFAAAVDFGTPATLPGKLAMLCAGIVISGFGEGLYLGARVGAGPRDGLMLGLVRLTGKRIWAVQAVIEIAVVAAGVALGGIFGIGTLIHALTIGYSIEFFLRLLTPLLCPATPATGAEADR